MSTRTRPLTTLALAAVAVLALTACGGSDEDDASSGASPDRSSFVPITAQGLAAVVDDHLGDRVSEYYVYDDEGQDDPVEERYVGVRLRGADPRDEFVVTVHPPGGGEGQVVPGSCPDDGAATEDPLATETCFPVKGGGNVTITTFPGGLAEDNKVGAYRMASSTGPKERLVTASYESYTKTPPVSDKQLSALLGDPELGWETSPKVNQAGQDIEIARAE